MESPVNKELKFNIIYVGGTVELLLPLISTMLKFTTCHFRLVSNGCSKSEENRLINFAESDSRLSFYSFKTDKMLRHHDILNELLYVDDSKYFAFIDSDMLADADFTQGLLEELDLGKAVTTGLPIWHEKKDWVMPGKYNIMGGKYLRSHNDISLGVTYCAIYDRYATQAFMEESGIKFNIYYWNEIPSHYQQVLESLDMKKEFYDTAKVFNILWQQSGGTVCYKPAPGLIHLGGISGDSDLGAISNKIRHFVISTLPFKVSGVIRSIYSKEFNTSIAESSDICYLAYRRRLTQAIFRNCMANNGVGKKTHKKLSKEYVEELKIVAQKVISANELFNNIDVN